MKLKSVEIENYKSYALNEKVKFSDLNVITGVNSTGKSSLIESLLILGQSDSHDILNGYLKKLGSVDSLKNNQLSKEESKTITFKYSFDVPATLDQIITIEDGKRPPTYPKIIDMAYLSAERIGILDSYKKSRDLELFNPRGEGLISLLYEKSDSKEFVIKNRELFFNNNKIREIFPKLPVYESNPIQQTILERKGIDYIVETSTKAELINIVNFWLEEFTGYTVSVDDISSKLLQLKYHKGGSEYEPQHVGTGVTFILFQILALLILPEETVVIIENPEIHLHPSLQSNLMYFYQWVSESNRQLFIETHSDHIFNVAKYFKLTNLDCTILFAAIEKVSDENLGEVLTTKIRTVELDENGTVIEYHQGLFDQYLKDNNKFYKVVYEKRREDVKKH